MNPASELESLEPVLDDALTDDADPIGVTFASGIHESDLIAHLERARGLAGEVC